MYIYQDEARKILDELLSSTITELNDKTNFMLSLLESDDWSMIIKSHALMESLVTELIVSKTEEPKLKALIERLPMIDDQIGKIKIAKDYDLLSSPQRAFVKRYSELRNHLVHRFENIDFDLDRYVASLDKNQKKSWQNNLTWFEHRNNVQTKWIEISLSKPKLALWFSVYMFANLVSLQVSELKAQSRIKDATDETTKILLSS